MPIAWWSLVGLCAAALINRAADCWFNPARLSCALTRHPGRQWAVWVGLPALFALLAWRNMGADGLWPACLFAAILIALAVIDWEQRRLPHAILLPAAALALAYAWADGNLGSAAAGGALAFALFLGFYGLGRRLCGQHALGAGDVKLAGLIGVMLGLELLPYALALGILAAGAAAAVLLLTGRARRGDALPYGHFLALAAVACLIGGAWLR
jgi:leader peptidase (prepilin peptidase)/N-methyltransferase